MSQFNDFRMLIGTHDVACVMNQLFPHNPGFTEFNRLLMRTLQNWNSLRVACAKTASQRPTFAFPLATRCACTECNELMTSKSKKMTVGMKGIVKTPKCPREV